MSIRLSDNHTYRQGSANNVFIERLNSLFKVFEIFKVLPLILLAFFSSSVCIWHTQCKESTISIGDQENNLTLQRIPQFSEGELKTTKFAV